MRQQTPLSKEQLAFLMRDERWWHPRKRDAAWQQMIVQGFERLYPANDAPQGEGGAVHVDAYARQRDGKRQAVAEHFRGRPGSGAKRPLPAADRDDVTPQELFDAVGFDPDGLSKYAFSALHPQSAAAAGLLAGKNFAIVAKLSKGDFSDNEWDAIRHAAWSFDMTINLGADRAKQFADAHERDPKEITKSRMMDLYNNHIGRELARDPKNLGRDPIAVARQAAHEGRLRLKPYPIDRDESAP